MTSVRVSSLRVGYDATQVLKGVDLDIADGEFFFLLGPSGCGKTTLLRSIAGFVEPSGGEIFFGKQTMNGVPAAKRDCGMVFQNYALWPHLTVFENVAFGLDVRKVEKQEKARRVLEALELVRMQDYADRPPGRLSGGQQQRVALARAIVVEPQILLLDEPLSNLDAKLRVELRSEIREIQKRTKRTAIYVTHDRAEALALADRMAVLRGGVVEQLGPPRDLYERPNSPFVAGFVGDVNALPAGRPSGERSGKRVVSGAFGEVSARSTGSVEIGSDRAFVFVRPERLKLDRAGTAGVDRLAGRIVRTTFLGEVVQYDVEVGGAVLRVIELSGAPLAAEGENVTVVVEDALVFATQA